jgi:DNA-binding NarL/FixJ family response regulator
MAPKRILIADDHHVVRSGLRSIVQAHDDWELVAEADNGSDAIALIAEKTPDVAIIDYSLPLINGIEVTRTIKAQGLETQVLIFTMHDDDTLIRDSFKAGARAFLLKSEAKGQLTAAIEALLAHKPYFSGLVSEKMLASYISTNAGPAGASLSSRERLVIQLVCEGHSNKSMSEVLNLSVKTIETHRASVMRKLSIKSTAGLVRYAIKEMLIEP